MADLAPDVTVDDSPAVASTMFDPPDQEGGTIVQNQSDTSLDSVIEIQGPTPQANPWQEFNLFLGAFAAKFRVTPMAANALIADMCQAISQQTYHAGGFLGLGAPPPID